MIDCVYKTHLSAAEALEVVVVVGVDRTVAVDHPMYVVSAKEVEGGVAVVDMMAVLVVDEEGEGIVQFQSEEVLVV